MNSINRFFTNKLSSGQFFVFRFLFCIAVLLYLLFNWFYVTGPYGGNYNPIPLFELFKIEQWSLGVNKILYILLLGSLSFLAFGKLPRIFTALSTVLFFLFMGNYLGSMKSPNSNYVWHSHNMILYILLALNFLPVNKVKTLSFQSKEFYLWELILLKLIVCTGYFGSAYIKLKTSGLNWMDGYTLQAYFIQKHILTGNTFALNFVDNLNLLIAISWFTVLLELIFCFGLLIRKTEFYVLGMLFGFHLMILLTLEINFINSHFLPISTLFLARPILGGLKRFLKQSPSS